MGDILSPQLRAIDAIEPRDQSLAEAREAGVPLPANYAPSLNIRLIALDAAEGIVCQIDIYYCMINILF